MPVLSEEQRQDYACFANLMTKEFISQQLILILGCMDVTEEGGRKHLLVTLQNILILPATSTTLIPLLAEKLLSILNEDDRRIQTIAEIISEVREPITTVDQPVDVAAIRKQELKLAEIKVKLFEAKQTLEECITLQDFNRASVLKEKITELERVKDDLIKAAEQPEIKDMRVEKSDPETLLKCLMLCYELLKIISLSKGIDPTIKEIIESLILPGVTNIHPAVRNMAVLCLGCCALQKKEFASQQLALLLQFSELKTEAAEGIARLMFSGRLTSAKLLSRLILLWYNPVTEEDTQLRHCLGVFFPLFAYANRSNQECLEEAYLPTMQTLLNAPATSPLAEIDINNVSELLVDLTRPSGLNPQCKKSQNYQDFTVHDSLAIKLCNEILVDPTAPNIRIYAKALNSLEISSSYTENLLLLLNEVIEKVKDKLCQRALEKVKMKLTKDPDVGKDCSERTEETDSTSENTAQNEEVNEVESEATAKLKSTRKKAGRGQQRAAAETRSVSRRKTGRAVKRSSESVDEIPESVPVSSSRPPRRAKTVALEKTRMNLSKVFNREAEQ
uniref:Non-SMC condensin I complex subunit G n=1 Tax=Hypotaenidia okinawae TaxID=2861861 RepID=A0A6G1R451_9GRUI